MAAGQPSIFTLTGGTSTSVAGAPFIWQPNLSVSPINITVASVVNSTATAPSYTVWYTCDAPPTNTVTATSSAGSVLATTGQSATWFTSLGANSSNSLFNITWPVRAITVVATAGTSVQTITTTIVQAG